MLWCCLSTKILSDGRFKGFCWDSLFKCFQHREGFAGRLHHRFTVSMSGFRSSTSTQLTRGQGDMRGAAFWFLTPGRGRRGGGNPVNNADPDTNTAHRRSSPAVANAITIIIVVIISRYWAHFSQTLGKHRENSVALMCTSIFSHDLNGSQRLQIQNWASEFAKIPGYYVGAELKPGNVTV